MVDEENCIAGGNRRRAAVKCRHADDIRAGDYVLSMSALYERLMSTGRRDFAPASELFYQEEFEQFKTALPSMTKAIEYFSVSFIRSLC